MTVNSSGKYVRSSPAIAMVRKRSISYETKFQPCLARTANTDSEASLYTILGDSPMIGFHNFIEAMLTIE